ncbi:MAG: 16S rRNA (cytidine(1402)-2'-O)-methyltransferase [Acidobacteriota bacterium]
MPLYLVATPIGNLEDITLRALRVLREVDLIACEDTRHTGRLLSHFGITTPTISYHEHNERSRADELVDRLIRGQSVAVVSDAGTPGISDPAYRVVVAAIERALEVIPIPGASALIAGLVASGLPSDSFLFAGFLPPKRNARRDRLTQLKALPSTLIFYEAPHRIRHTLSDAAEILGDRRAVVCRELTKMHEEFVRGTLGELRDGFGEREPRGEMTLVIAPGGDDNLIEVETGSLSSQMERLMEAGLSRNEALKRVASSRAISKKAAYRLLVEESNARTESETNSDPDS